MAKPSSKKPAPKSAPKVAAKSSPRGSSVPLKTPAKAARPSPTKASPTKASPTKASPAKASPAKASPTKANPTKANPTKANPTKANPVKANPVKASPAKANPAKANPAKASPSSAAPKPAPSTPAPTAKAGAAKPATKAAKIVAPKSSPPAKAKAVPLVTPPPIIAAKVELRPPPPPKHRAVLAAAANAAASAASSTATASSAGTTSAPNAPSADGKPVPPRPSRPPAPVTGTAAMKNLAQRNAAALRPATDLAEMSSEAQRILSENDTAAVAALGEALAAERSLPQTAKVLDDVLAAKPDLLVGLVDRFVVLVASPQKRTVQTTAAALPVMARLAPARVARHLQTLTDRFPECSEVGKDGLVSTFAALCMASVAYQKRLEPVLELALSSADPKSLQRWAEIILPSLKGEPHARARAVVEGRLPAMPRPLAQPIANFLGIKLRPAQ